MWEGEIMSEIDRPNSAALVDLINAATDGQVFIVVKFIEEY
jgi:hypothetical protein